VLEIENLVKHYPAGADGLLKAVDGVSMSVGDGELAVLYGPSGSGKTTLLDLIAGLRPPDGGTIRVDGRDVVGMSRREADRYRLRHLGIMGQPHNVTPGASVLASASLKLILMRKRRTNTTLVPLLTRLGLGERLGERTEVLSMGERQRVTIAMALAPEPRLVLADEPTGNLDTVRTREVLELLRQVCGEWGATVLLATHDPAAAAFADQKFELRDGRLREYTPPDAPMEQRG
jgi:putative ABC transport system ATP-binding protein